MEKKISKKFFGTELDKTFERVLITNVTSIYEGIIKKAKVIKRDKGFYHNSFIEIKNKSLRIIKITPGNVIVDVLKLLQNKVNEIILVGLVGSLNDNFKIGDIVIPAESVSFNNIRESIKFFDPDAILLGKVCQTDGLIQNRKFHANLVADGIDFVDMESYYVAQFSLKNKKISKLIGVVSDNPITKPFYEINNQSQNIDYASIINKI